MIEKPVRWISWMVIAAGAAHLLRLAPTDQWSADISTWGQQLGAWGPLVFGAALVLGAIALLPTVALTLPAGAVLGPWLGALTISVATTVAAAIAFLVARYVARRRMLALFRGDPRFAAVDGAIGQNGWRLVALFRLSLAVPFGISNYAFGLSSVRFVPYLFTSWLAMLPACLLYGWLGHVGARGFEREAILSSTEGWLFAASAILTTIFATWYAQRVVRAAMASVPAAPAHRISVSPWRMVAVAALALIVVAGGVVLAPKQEAMASAAIATRVAEVDPIEGEAL